MLQKWVAYIYFVIDAWFKALAFDVAILTKLNRPYKLNRILKGKQIAIYLICSYCQQTLLRIETASLLTVLLNLYWSMIENQ